MATRLNEVLLLSTRRDIVILCGENIFVIFSPARILHEIAKVRTKKSYYDDNPLFVCQCDYSFRINDKRIGPAGLEIFKPVS